MQIGPFSVLMTSLILCRKFWIRKSHHYGGQPWMCKQWTVAKQTERFSLTAKRRGYFLLLEDNKSKQRYKVKINNIYDTRVWPLSDKKRRTLVGMP